MPPSSSSKQAKVPKTGLLLVFLSIVAIATGLFFHQRLYQKLQLQQRAETTTAVAPVIYYVGSTPTKEPIIQHHHLRVVLPTTNVTNQLHGGPSPSPSSSSSPGPSPSPSSSPKGQLIIFYNIYINPLNVSNSLAIVKEQLEARAISRKARRAPVFYVTIGENNATETDTETETGKKLPIPCYNCHHLQHLDQGSELNTISYMHRHCLANPHDSVMYLHNKGSFTSTIQNDRLRFHLGKAIFSDVCLDTITNPTSPYMTCSAKFSITPFFGYIGNMFVAKCTYVRKLIPPHDFAAAKQHVLSTMLTSSSSSSSDYYRLGGKPWAMERISWMGIGRYAMEHWICSHPHVVPMQVYPNERFSYNMKHISRQWKPIIRMPSLAKKDKRFMEETLPPWFHLPGKLYEWQHLYNGTVPPSDSWIYPIFEPVEIRNWTNVNVGHETVIFFNIYINPSNVSRSLEIVQEQLSERRKAMSAATVPLYYVTIGARNFTTMSKPGVDQPIEDCSNCHWLEHLDEGTELNTLHHVYTHCLSHPKDIIVYLHNKGSFTQSEQNDKLRWHLTRSLFLPDCLHNLGNFTSCSAKFSVSPFFGYVGNMFNAKCEYIQKLIPPFDFSSEMEQVLDDMRKDKEHADYFHYGGNNFSMERPSWLGTGRYAAEHWIASHPSIRPAQVYPNNKFTYRIKDLSYQWKPNMRSADISRKEIHFTETNLPPWFHLVGKLYQWKHLYDAKPDNSSWIWDLYSNVRTFNWTERYAHPNESNVGAAAE
jgi:hypothetical protein